MEAQIVRSNGLSFVFPKLKEGEFLAKPVSDYFPGNPADWADLPTEKKDQHIIELCRNRCPILGTPGDGESLTVVRVEHSTLFDKDILDAPWMYLAVMSSSEEGRDMASKIDSVSGESWKIRNWDPLDENGGFEVMNHKHMILGHSSLDFYTRSSRTAAKAAEEWHAQTCAAWSHVLKGLYEFSLYMNGAKDHVAALGFTNPKEWLSTVGIKLPSLSKLFAVLSHPSNSAELWSGELNISPFVLAAFLAKVPEDRMAEWAPKLKEMAAFRPLLGGSGGSDVDGFLAELNEEFKKEPKDKHYLVFPGAVQYTELDGDVPQDPDGLTVTVIEGKLSWKGKVNSTTLGLPFGS